jgi:hypothetical protein
MAAGYVEWAVMRHPLRFTAVLSLLAYAGGLVALLLSRRRNDLTMR